MAKRLIHVVIDFQTIEEDRGVFIGHQVSGQPITGEIAPILVVRAQFVMIDDSQCTFRIVVRKENFVQPGITLGFVQPFDELLRGDVIFPSGELIEQGGDVRARADLVVKITELLEGEIGRIDFIVLEESRSENEESRE